MFLSQHITSNHSLSFFFISKEILAIARARGQRFPFCCSHCHTSALLLLFQSSEVCNRLGFFFLSSAEHLGFDFIFLSTSFQEPCKQDSRLWHCLGTHPSPEPCESGQALL